jgi:tRNA(adenine34) deaminase
MSSSFPVSAGMALALEQARAAAACGEVPVGAVVTGPDGKLIAADHNRTRSRADPTAHAEMLVLRAAAELLGQERLEGCTLWVTLEPCAMCAGAIAHARVRRLVYAAQDPKGGAVEHGPRLYSQPTIHHRPEVISGVGETHAAELLRAFFAARRDR